MNALRILKQDRAIVCVIVCVLLVGLLVTAAVAQEIAATEDNPMVVVGIFDSRAIAVAYVQSEAFGSYMGEQQAAVAQLLERAKSAGNEQLVAGLEALGPALQKRLHEQGFGTAPVDDIIARIEDKLPEIAEKAGVDMIISKWTLTYCSPAARFVDVTNLVAAEFNPDARTLKMIESTIEAEPVPLGELEHDH
jgi:hypothetical protein